MTKIKLERSDTEGNHVTITENSGKKRRYHIETEHALIIGTLIAIQNEIEGLHKKIK